MKHLLLIVIILLLCLPVFAQDATPTPDATQEAPIVINIESPETPAPSDGSLWGYVLVIGGVIVSGFVGMSFVLQGIGNRAAQAANNPLEVAVLEKAHDSVPQAIVEGIIKPLKESLERSDDALRKMITLFEKVTDRIPEASKTEAAPPDANGFTSTSTPPLP